MPTRPLNRSFWRRVCEKGQRPLPVAVEAECRQRIDFVLGQVDLTEVTPRRWLGMPALTEAERAKLEAVRVAEPSERLQALEAAFAEGLFDFVANLLASSYSRHGRRAHHPLLLMKIRLGILAVGSASPGDFLRTLDDSAMHITGLLGWLIEECRRFCQAAGRSGLSEEDRTVLLGAFEDLDWKSLGNFGRNRQGLIRAIRDTLNGQFVTPLPGAVTLDCRPREGHVSTDLVTFAKSLAAEFLQRIDPLRSASAHDVEAGSLITRSDHASDQFDYRIQFRRASLRRDPKSYTKSHWAQLSHGCPNVGTGRRSWYIGRDEDLSSRYSHSRSLGDRRTGGRWALARGRAASEPARADPGHGPPAANRCVQGGSA